MTNRKPSTIQKCDPDKELSTSDKKKILKIRNELKFELSDLTEFFNNYQMEQLEEFSPSCLTFKNLRLVYMSLNHPSYLKDSKQGVCAIYKGHWTNLWGRKSIKEAKDVLVESVLPIEEIYRCGGHSWTMKDENWQQGDPIESWEAYFKSFERPELFATISRTGIRSRKELKITEKRPFFKDVKCEYIGQWTIAKNLLGLGTTPEEDQWIEEMDVECQQYLSENFNRKSRFGKWIDEDRDCQNTRSEVLARDSKSSVTGKCKIQSGEWVGAFTNQKFTNAGDIDIDHLVPLKKAYVSGAWRWPKWKRIKYANDLSKPKRGRFAHLLSVYDRENQSKSDRGPADYLPKRTRIHCKYVKSWIDVIQKWELALNPRDARKIEDVLKTCN